MFLANPLGLFWALRLQFILGGIVEKVGLWVDRSKKTVNLSTFKIILAYSRGLL